MSRGAAGPGVALGLCALLAACSGGLPPTHYYTLAPPAEVSGPGARAALGPGLVVGVEPLAVDPPYDQDRLVYRGGTDSSEVGFYAYHRWASPVGSLVAVALADGLRGTPGIAAIEPAVSSGTYTARLGGRVLYLEEVGRGEAREARIALDLSLRSAEGETLWSETLTGAAGGRAESAADVILQVRAALDALLVEARRELAAALGP